MIVPVCNHRGHSVLNPVAYAACAEIVEEQHLGVEGSAISFLITRTRSTVKARKNALEQSLVIQKRSLETLVYDAAQRRDSKVRLAPAGVAHNQQPGFLP